MMRTFLSLFFWVVVLITTLEQLVFITKNQINKKRLKMFQ